MILNRVQAERQAASGRSAVCMKVFDPGYAYFGFWFRDGLRKERDLWLEKRDTHLSLGFGYEGKARLFC